jgi:hypothetical protein
MFVLDFPSGLVGGLFALGSQVICVCILVPALRSLSNTRLSEGLSRGEVVRIGRGRTSWACPNSNSTGFYLVGIFAVAQVVAALLTAASFGITGTSRTIDRAVEYDAATFGWNRDTWKDESKWRYRNSSSLFGTFSSICQEVDQSGGTTQRDYVVLSRPTFGTSGGTTRVVCGDKEMMYLGAEVETGRITGLRVRYTSKEVADSYRMPDRTSVLGEEGIGDKMKHVCYPGKELVCIHFLFEDGAAYVVVPPSFLISNSALQSTYDIGVYRLREVRVSGQSNFSTFVPYKLIARAVWDSSKRFADDFQDDAMLRVSIGLAETRGTQLISVVSGRGVTEVTTWAVGLASSGASAVVIIAVAALISAASRDNRLSDIKLLDVGCVGRIATAECRVGGKCDLSGDDLLISMRNSGGTAHLAEHNKEGAQPLGLPHDCELRGTSATRNE